MTNRISTLMVSIALSATPYASAVIPYAAKYVLGDKECYLIYDMHIDEPGGKRSKEQLETLLAEGKKQQATFIIEDILTYSGDDAAIKNTLERVWANIQKGAPMAGSNIMQYSGLCKLEERCKKEELRVVNTEFRHDCLHKDLCVLQGNMQEATVVFKKLLNIFRSVTNNIKRYNDNAILDIYYLKTATKLEKALDYLEAHADSTALTPDEQVQTFDFYWECMKIALDASIAHAWHSQQSHTANPIVVYAGAEHVQALEKLLLAQGYTKVSEQGDKSDIQGLPLLRHQLNKARVALTTQNQKILVVFSALIKTAYRSSQFMYKYLKCIETAKKVRLKKLFNNQPTKA